MMIADELRLQEPHRIFYQRLGASSAHAPWDCTLAFLKRMLPTEEWDGHTCKINLFNDPL
jgi:hypothetical protein